MPFALAQIPGFANVADSVLEAEDVALGVLLQRTSENAKFGTVRPEFFFTKHAHGETVPLPLSSVDGYAYSREELVYVWSLGSTANPQDGTRSGGGNFWRGSYSVDQDTGEVSCETFYFRHGHESTESNDGTLNVFTIGIRRRESLLLTGIPAWVNRADADVAADKAFTTGLAVDLARNAKRAVVSAEAIYMGEFGNGQTISRPVSPVDGYQYQYSEVKFLHSWRWTTAFTKFDTTAPVKGTPQRFSASINSGNGAVTTSVTYVDGSATATTHGRLAVIALCFRSSGLTISGTVAFSDLGDEQFFAGQPLTQPNAEALVRNAKFSALRPEFFTSTRTHGQTVALPTSPVDSYAYTRAELFYLYEWEDTGPPTAQGNHAQLEAHIDQASGIVSITNWMYVPGGRLSQTTAGTLKVITVGMRSATAVTSTGPVSGTPVGGGASEPFGELQNGSFERWNSPLDIIADGWSEYDKLGSGTYSRQSGLHGDSAQGLNVPTPGAGNHAAIISARLTATEGDIYALNFSALATVAIANGFYARIVLRNADLSAECSFDPRANVALGTSPTRTNVTFIMPANGATTVATSLGNKSINGTLNFTPAYAFLVFYNFQPNVGSTVIIDWVTWRQIEEFRGRFDPTGLRLDSGLGVTGRGGVLSGIFSRLEDAGDFSIFGRVGGRSAGLLANASTIIFQENFDEDISAFWNLRLGSWANVTYPANGQAGGKVIRIPSGLVASSNQVWAAFPINVPFDPSRLYRIRARYRKLSGSNGSTIYVGVEGVAADGTTLVNVSGSNTSSSQHYICVAGENTTPGSGWTVKTSYFKGWKATGDSGNFPSPASPAGLHTNVRYFRPMFIIGHQPVSGDTDEWELDVEIIEMLPDGAGEIVRGGTVLSSVLTNVTDSGNLGTGGRVGGDSGILASRVDDAIFDTGSEARVRLGRYYDSAVRKVVGLSAGGFTSAGSWATVAQLAKYVQPSGKTTFGPFNISVTLNYSTLPSTWTLKGRLRAHWNAGANQVLSSEKVITNPDEFGDLLAQTLTGLPVDTEITFDVQAERTAVSGGSGVSVDCTVTASKEDVEGLVQ